HDDYEGAVLVDHGVDIEPQVAKAFERALAGLRGVPDQVTLEDSNSRIRFAGFIGVSKAMADDLGGVAKSEHLAKLLTYGPKRSIADWAEDQAIIVRTAKRVHTILDEHGFLIMPTVPNPPFPHSDPEPAAQADFTCLANIAGCPALSMPMGYTEDGLPLGVQIVGSPGHEAGLFALARYLDNNLRAYRAPEPARGA
ncbi:MAG: amidase family protein, partial [Parvularcula sp.]|nr:amidase family protein [Parvularcula sp.]